MSPSVELLAHTVITGTVRDRLPVDPWPLAKDRVHDADHLHEYAGRACYDSWHRPNSATAANPDYLAHVLDQGHESVTAHASATFHLTGVSRSLTHELIRHRYLAVSERSLRFVGAENLRPVYPPAADEYDRASIDLTFSEALSRYRTAVGDYEARGLPRKQAREAARAHLPLCTETSIVVTGNMRAWRDFLRQRLSPHADAEIRAVAQVLHAALQEIAPNTFQDLAA